MNQKIKELEELIRKQEEVIEIEVKRRKKAEETLVEVKENFKLALKELPVIIFATDEDGSVVFNNREFERISGYSKQELFENPDIIEMFFPGDGEAQKSPSEIKDVWNFHNKNGEKKYVVWSKVSSFFPFYGWKSWKIGLDVTELKEALDKIKTLSGLLPICASCKKIRDDEGYWNQIESYISNYSEVSFSHSICPDCAKSLYPDLEL